MEVESIGYRGRWRWEEVAVVSKANEYEFDVDAMAEDVGGGPKY